MWSKGGQPGCTATLEKGSVCSGAALPARWRGGSGAGGREAEGRAGGHSVRRAAGPQPRAVREISEQWDLKFPDCDHKTPRTDVMLD